MFIETLRMAVQVLVRNPVRSALTVLGLAIGVGAFIAMVTFGEGARQSVVGQFEAMGTNILNVASRASEKTVGDLAPKPLSDRDVRALERDTTSLARVVPVARAQADVSAGGRSERYGVLGTTAAWFPLRQWPTSIGGAFDETDDETRAKVCVIGQTVADALFEAGDPLGQVMRVGDMPCRVVGILERRGQSMAGTDQDEIVVLPSTTFGSYLAAEAGYWRLMVQPTSKGLMDVAREEITEVLRRSHAIPAGAPDDFTIRSPDDATRAADDVSKTMTALLAGIAGVSLLVGGIGIMNILLVSVTERTREIGVRAAIGASPRQILTQFLAEAIALALVGSAAGAALGIGAAIGVAEAMKWPQTLSAGTVLVSAGFGTVTGILFGWLPARRAANLDPIQALRHE